MAPPSEPDAEPSNGGGGAGTRRRESGMSAAFSSFAAPTSFGSRTSRKSSHVRVVARIRPLSGSEAAGGCEPAIFPLNEHGAVVSDSDATACISPRSDDDHTDDDHTVGSSSCGSSVADMAARFGGRASVSSPTPGHRRGRSGSGLPGSIICSPGTPTTTGTRKAPPIDGSDIETPRCKNTSGASSFSRSSRDRRSAPPVPSAAAFLPREGFFQPPSPALRKRNGGSTTPADPVALQSLAAGKSENAKKFEYDAVFRTTASQREVYAKSVGDAVKRNIFRGFNTTILAYGQTGSGKTYTMNGPADPDDDFAEAAVTSPLGKKRKTNRNSLSFPNGRRKLLSPKASKKELDSEASADVDMTDEGCAKESNIAERREEKPFVLSDEDGIIPRAVHDLFKAKQRHSTAGDVVIAMTYLEIYNDEIRDLLAGDDDDDDVGQSLQLRDNGENSGGVSIKGLTTVTVSTPSQVRSLMDAAERRRTTGATSMNARSSRSHSICSLHVTVSPALDRGVTSGRLGSGIMTSTDVISAKLTLVDLAGSERLKQTGAVGLQKQEGININKDLFVLGKVVSALADKASRAGGAQRGGGGGGGKPHIPYRDCKLTRILRDSLGGNCCTVMVACVSPADANLDESVNTLRYAERAKAITNSIKQNVSGRSAATPAESAAMRRENILLRGKIDALGASVAALEEELGGREEPVDNTGNRPLPDGHTEVELERLREEVVALRKQVTGLEADSTDNGSTEPMLEAHQDGAAEVKGSSSEDPENDIDVESVASGLTQEDYFGLNDASASKCDDSLASCSKSRPFMAETLSAAARRMNEVDDEIAKKKALRDRLDDELFVLQEKVDSLQSLHDNLKSELETSLKTEVGYKIAEEEAQSRRGVLQQEIAQLKESQTGLKGDNAEAQAQVECLVSECTALVDEINCHKERSVLAAQLKEAQSIIIENEDELAKFRADREILASERDELRVKLMVQESVQKEKDEEAERLKEEVRLLRSEVQDLSGGFPCGNGEGKENGCPKTPPRACGSVGKKHESLTPNARLTERILSGDRDTIDPIVSFPASGEDEDQKLSLPSSSEPCGSPASVKSEQMAIRLHAERMIFLANRAMERSSSCRSLDTSMASSRQDSLPLTRASSGSVQTSKCIGSFPQSRARNKLPPSKAPEEGSASSSIDRTVTRVAAASLVSSEATTVVDGATKKREASGREKSSRAAKAAKPDQDAAGVCTCSTSMFSGNEAQIDLLLPKLGMACTCGKSKTQEPKTFNSDDPASLTHILRPWQVEFLESVGITSAEQVTQVQKREAKDFARKMKSWRVKRRMQTAKTRSCYIALHIWARTAKVFLKTIETQRRMGHDVVTTPKFLEVSFQSAHNSSGCSVSTIGCGSVVEEKREDEMEI